MVYRTVGADAVIAKVIDMFNIQATEFVTRCPVWIGEALGLMGSYPALTPTREAVTITSYRGSLPCHIKVLMGMEYNNVRLRRLDALKKNQYSSGVRPGPVVAGFNYVNTKVYDDNGVLLSSSSVFDSRFLDLSYDESNWYSLLSNNYFETSFEEGTVYVHYRKYPTDPDSGLPLIPDNEKAKLAISFYILWMLLARGYKHPVYAIGHSNPSLDPYKLWEDYRLRGRNSISATDEDQRKLYHDMFITMVPSFVQWSERLR